MTDWPKRRAFYSFYYREDSWRASQVRNIGVIEGNRPATDNDWEVVKRKGDASIAYWIKSQMIGRSCTIVLAGTNTADRKWINYRNHRVLESRYGRCGCVYSWFEGCFRRELNNGFQSIFLHSDSGGIYTHVKSCDLLQSIGLEQYGSV